MPSNWLYIDTNFPSFTQKESVNDKVETMQDYLFMLVEQLRYTLHNLDLSNMNKAAADGFVKTITQPIYAEIKNAEGSITQLGVTAEGLAARMSSAEGNITQLQATAKGLQVSVSNLDGAITNIKTDVNGIRATVSTKIDATQAQSIFDQSAEGFTLGVTSDENGTIFKLNYNGAQIASTGSIDLYVDAVNIYGTLTATEIEGDRITVRNDAGRRCGYISTEYASTADYKMTLESKAMELNATSGNLYLSGNNGRSALNFDYDFIDCRGDFAPNADNRYNLGAPNFVWSAIYCSTNELNGSDRNIKNSIEALPEKYVRMFDLVEPKRYKLNSGTSGRFHTGFIAQEVEDAMRACGINSQEFAGWAAAKRKDGSETYFLRYSEFIPVLWAKVREQEERLKRLEESA
jgi:cell wall surface anchor family protein|nr:MAG TPA: endosialidase chaperone [Bacteriophage sp.]